MKIPYYYPTLETPINYYTLPVKYLFLLSMEERSCQVGFSHQEQKFEGTLVMQTAQHVSVNDNGIIGCNHRSNISPNKAFIEDTNREKST